MKKIFKFPSLVQQYIAFCVAIMIISIGVSIFFSYMNFKNFVAKKDFEFKKESINIQHKIDEKIYYAENMIKYLAQLLVKSENYSYTNISYLIQHQKEHYDSEILTTPVIDYIDLKGRMIIDSLEGIRKVPIIVNGIRKWIQEAKEDPWKVYFAKPDHGLISKEFVIPMGIAISDEKDIVRGFLSLGIGVDNLVKYLKQGLNENFNIVLLDGDKKFITSTGTINQNEQSVFRGYTKKINFIDDAQPYKLSKPFVVNSNIFTHYTKLERYPFYILIGEDMNSYYDSFRDEIIFLIIKNVLLGIFSSMILLVFAYQIIKPILELGNNAKKISKGEAVELKDYPTEELNILSQQLQRIHTINKDLSSKQSLLTKANNKLINANNFIKSNMSFMTHELKNPTLSVIDFSEELAKEIEKTKISEQANQYIDMICKISKYQNKQIDYFLQLFKFQETGKDIEKEPVNLEEIIYWNVSMIKHLANQKNIKIITEIMPMTPKIIGDKIMIGQLVQNLVSNGIKYNRDGGTLKIKVFAQNNSAKREIIMRFEDNGPGIDKKDIKKIFKKFERIKNEEYSKSFGYGIGLSYVKACVVAHDGEIYISTRLGKGTAFTVTFPKSRIYMDY